jgi:exopolyphosphatase/guanosine-5'-triphosphate,3'-diphosphate pyrophosphatase
MSAETPAPPIAVIDIGSNSARVVVLKLDGAGHLRMLAGSRAALRLVHDVDETHRLTEVSMGRAMEALRDFRALAQGAGAERIVAVATAAVRDADNSEVFIERVRRELGFEVEVIDGKREAYYGFLGAVRGLSVESGVLFDLGGGSLQTSQFRARQPGRAESLPLGALRLSETFLKSDPPKRGEVRRLQEHASKTLQAARLGKLRPGETLIGTGGTVRNLAKVDRRAHGYPITRLHGYALPLRRVSEMAAHLSSLKLKKREAIPGLSVERGDSIVGGALAVETLMEALGASEILVSGQGVREGLAYSLLNDGVRSPREVREASLRSLTSRFDGWNAEAADRRRAIAAALVRGLEPRARPDIVEALDYAAWTLDLGRSIDFFNRHEHVADILLATELNGFTHHQIALTSAVVRRTGDPQFDPRRLAPLVTPADREAIERAAVILALADDIEERCPRGVAVEVFCETGRQITVYSPQLAAWRSRALGARFERAFGKPLLVRPGVAPTDAAASPRGRLTV